MGRSLWPAVAIFACLLAAGCGETLGPDANLADLFPDELEAGRWNTIEPGGDTICSRGTPYRFHVWPGRADRVVVNFFGGGACWGEASCSEGSGLFAETAQDAPGDNAQGLHDMRDERNPVADYTHIAIPYCTGDIHWGDAVVEYNDSLTINHKGAVNARAVLDWVEAHIESPERVLTTGCSAGGYGALPHAVRVIDSFPDARHVVFGDSAAGVLSTFFFEQDFPNWNARPSFPARGGVEPSNVMRIADAYTAYANAYPDTVWSQFNTTNDATQILFFLTTGGQPTDGGTVTDTWRTDMLAQAGEAAAGASNYRYYIGGDDPATEGVDESLVHCTIPQAEFYTRDTEGLRPVDFVEALLDGNDVPNTACSGCEPPLP